MFTGIVEELGEVLAVQRRGDAGLLAIAASGVAKGLTRGASVSVNGVCLTVIGCLPLDGDRVRIEFDVMGETLARSVLGSADAGDPMNLERAVRADARLDGHVVQGHVDGTGIVLSRRSGDGWDVVRIGLPQGLAPLVAEKGSIAVDGVSLTVTAVGADWFEIGLIPETLRATTLGTRQVGDPVNLETDVLARYVARLMAVQP